MSTQKGPRQYPVGGIKTETQPLQLIVPFTTPELTQNALDEADKLVSQLNARIRVIAIQTVPTAFSLDRPPVSSGHLERILRTLLSCTPTRAEIYLVRDPKQAWVELLRARTLIVLASRKRIWGTREERLAKMLERHGHEVILIYPGTNACSI